MKKPPPFHLLPLFLKKRLRRKNAVFLLPIPNEKRKKEGKRNRAEIMKNRMSDSIHFLSQKLKIRRALPFSCSFPKKERKEEQMEEIASKFMKKKKTLFIARMNKVFELSAIN